MKLGEICSQCVLCFFLILLMWTGITYVTQNIQYTRAKQVHDELVMRIVMQRPLQTANMLPVNVDMTLWWTHMKPLMEPRQR